MLINIPSENIKFMDPGSNGSMSMKVVIPEAEFQPHSNVMDAYVNKEHFTLKVDGTIFGIFMISSHEKSDNGFCLDLVGVRI